MQEQRSMGEYYQEDLDLIEPEFFNGTYSIKPLNVFTGLDKILYLVLSVAEDTRGGQTVTYCNLVDNNNNYEVRATSLDSFTTNMFPTEVSGNFPEAVMKAASSVLFEKGLRTEFAIMTKSCGITGTYITYDGPEGKMIDVDFTVPLENGTGTFRGGIKGSNSRLNDRTPLGYICEVIERS